MTAAPAQVEVGGDPAVAAVFADLHRACDDCVAGRCEAGAWARRLLAEHRRRRAAEWLR